jgi:[acyl-carrier-protein] S-malonyltransferase
VIASLFIGQGVDLPWIDDDLLAQPIVRDYVGLASEHARCDVMKLLTRGGRDLARSEVVQPAMVAVCLGVQRLLDHARLAPAIALGHSLGELTAWAAAGGIRDADAIALAATRGRLMAREAVRHPGGMVRLKCDREGADRVVAEIGGSLWVSAHNGPDEHALSGDEAALGRVIARHPAVRLGVAGAWHCPLMAGAVDEFARAVAAVSQQPLHAQLIANRDGSLATAATIAELFVSQLVHPVQWIAAVTTLARLEPRRIFAVGPGKTLRALVHKNLGVARHVSMLDSMRAIEAASRA